MDKESFEFTYSAPEQEEIRRIREKYVPRQENKLDQLRKLDAGVTRKANYFSILIGMLGTLVMGAGMSMCMVWADALMIPGIVMGVIGMAGVGAAFPMYRHILEKERIRIAPEILRLTEELERGN